MRFFTNRPLLNHLAYYGIAIFLGKGISFFKEAIIAYYYGTTVDLDMVLYASTIASTVFLIFGGTIATTVLPNYLYFKNISENDKNNYLFAAFSLFVIISILLSIILWVFGFELISLMAPGFTHSQVLITSTYLNYFLLFIILSFVGALFHLLLNAEKKFFYSGITTIFIPTFIVLFVLIFHEHGVKSIIFGTIIGSIFQLIFSISQSKKFFKLKKVTYGGVFSKYRDLLNNFSILLFSGLFIGLIDITDQSFASLAQEGSISSLNYANKIPALFDGLIVMVLGTVLFSTFSENIACNKIVENKRLYLKSMKWVFFFGSLIAIVFAFFSKELTMLVFQRGKFDNNSVLSVYPVQVAFFLRLPFSATAIISARMMNSLQLNKEMLIINLFSFIFNIILDYYLVKYYGVAGIAYATLIVYIWASILNYFTVIRKFKKILA